MTSSSDFRSLYIATERGLLQLDLETQQTMLTELSGGTRVARIQEGDTDLVLVTLRRQRAMALLRPPRLALERTIELGAEPFGIVASEDGSRFYVVSALSGLVQEFRSTGLTLLRSWNLPNEPRWLALHPSNRALYVGAARGGTTFWIDLVTGNVLPIELPPSDGSGFEGEPTMLAPRVTGDPAVTPDGNFLLIPMLYVDNTSTIFEREVGEPRPDFPNQSYSDRMQPVMAMVPLDGDGAPTIDQPELITLFDFSRIRSYPSGVTVSPDGKLAVLPLEGADHVVVVELDPPSNLGDRIADVPSIGFGTFTSRPLWFIKTDTGPSAIAFTSAEEGFVYSFIDLTVAPINLRSVSTAQSDAAAIPPGIQIDNVSNGFQVITSTLPASVLRGRRLFYSSMDPVMTEPGSGVSCATCHFDGRTDGLTWTFEKGPRQTPSLAGKVSSRAPVRWEGDRATVGDDAISTVENLMGGMGLSSAQASDIEAFIDSTWAVDVPLKGASDPLIDVGRALFFRPDVACSNCHNGPLFSDLQKHTVLGRQATKTPSLLGIDATPPYFHDGSAPDLMTVLNRSRDGSMGNTSSLSSQEMRALELYLRSL